MQEKEKYLIATDLDRTLLPNGNQEYDGSMDIFNRIIKHERFKIVYVTGRNIKLVKEAMKEFHTPPPDFIIADVGTKIHLSSGNGYEEDLKWQDMIRQVTKGWSFESFREELSIIKGMRIQEDEKQNDFKLSYYVDDVNSSEIIIKEATKMVKSICPDAVVVYSLDETHNIGLLDILPIHATKLTSLEYMRKKLNLTKEEIIYCGDSGNDILPLTNGYRSILVRNAIESVKTTVKQISIQKDFLHNLHIAKGYKKLNGFYVSGIIEGLIKLGVISSDYAN